MMTFFRLLKILEASTLEDDAERTRRQLTAYVEVAGPDLQPHSHVAIDLCQNWRKTSEEMVDWYANRGTKKAASTIRSQQCHLSNHLYRIFGSADTLQKIFLGNDTEGLREIRHRVYSMRHSDISLSDFVVDLSSILVMIDKDFNLEDKDEEVDLALDFLRKINRKYLAENIDAFDTAEKREVLSTVLAFLLQPLILDETYEIVREDGTVERATHLVFNKNKSDLINRMRALKDFSLPSDEQR